MNNCEGLPRSLRSLAMTSLFTTEIAALPTVARNDRKKRLAMT